MWRQAILAAVALGVSGWAAYGWRRFRRSVLELLTAIRDELQRR